MIITAGKDLNLEPVRHFFDEKDTEYKQCQGIIKGLQAKRDSLLRQHNLLKCFTPFKNGSGCGPTVKASCEELGNTISMMSEVSDELSFFFLGHLSFHL